CSMTRSEVRRYATLRRNTPRSTRLRMLPSAMRSSWASRGADDPPATVPPMNPPDSVAVAAQETLIAPPVRFKPVKPGELWSYRELIYFLTKRELQVRYKQSFFGVTCAILHPLVFAFIFALFFGVVLN